MKPSFFNIIHKSTDTKARCGIINTKHGPIKTPVFMPVGTNGAVKAITKDRLISMGTDIILGNTYHLYLRPGIKVLEKMGGLHKFINWDKPVLTDSGGYQVFSLAKLSKITDKGYYFQSHIDGHKDFFSPEKVIEIQQIIGSDIIMPLDQCIPFYSEEKLINESVSRTVKWAEKSKITLSKNKNTDQHLFGIVQGASSKKQRESCVKQLTDIGFDGYSIGGLSVGETQTEMYEFIAFTTGLLADKAPHYLMGVGTPRDIIEGVKCGIDMFDCVLPTRNARNATVYKNNGKILLRNEENKFIDKPISSECSCYTCRNFSRSYLRHLFKAKEINACILASIHNIHFYLDFMQRIRREIAQDTFYDFYKEFILNWIN